MNDILLRLRDSGDEVPAVNRLRSLLKSTLRRHGFRCVSIEEVRDTPPDAQAGPLAGGKALSQGSGHPEGDSGP